MARISDDTDPTHGQEHAGAANTEERVIGSLLDGLDAPQPVVRSRSGKRARAGDSTPPPAGPGDRHAPTALLPAVEQRQRKRRTFALAFVGIAVVLGAIALARHSEEAKTAAPLASVATAAPSPMHIPSNTQMNNSTATAPTAPAAIAPMPTVALSSLPSLAPSEATSAKPPASAASDRPHTSARPPGTNGSSSSNHAEIKEDSL